VRAAAKTLSELFRCENPCLPEPDMACDSPNAGLAMTSWVIDLVTQHAAAVGQADPPKELTDIPASASINAVVDRRATRNMDFRYRIFKCRRQRSGAVR